MQFRHAATAAAWVATVGQTQRQMHRNQGQAFKPTTWSASVPALHGEF